MKTIKRTLILLVVFTTLLSCGLETRETADQIQKRQTEQSLQEANKQIGMPSIVNFQERKLFKMILELRDQENLITYCYLVNERNGSIGQFLGKGIGYGIPASTQYTNPQKIAVKNANYGTETLPQADPNGLFMPTSSDATWYMLIDKKTGKPRPVYIEPKIIVSPFKLH